MPKLVDELELLLLLVETYEASAYPIDLPDPITALRFRMEQQGEWLLAAAVAALVIGVLIGRFI